MKTFYFVMALVLSCFVLALCVTLVQNYFYPMSYRQEILSVSKESEVPPSLIASVTNVESSFRADSVSSRGAVGLMQLMPSTAEWICGKMKIEYDESKLVEPHYNLRIGAYYLSYLLGQFDDQTLALCAYNAGPTTVKSWLNNSDYSEGGKLKTIPFTETRNYITKVNKNLYFYKNKYK